jgi:hypothetical protein
LYLLLLLYLWKRAIFVPIVPGIIACLPSSELVPWLHAPLCRAS